MLQNLLSPQFCKSRHLDEATRIRCRNEKAQLPPSCGIYTRRPGHVKAQDAHGDRQPRSLGDQAQLTFIPSTSRTLSAE